MNLVVMVYLDINLGDDLFLKTLIDRYKGHNLYIIAKNKKFLFPFEKYKNVFGVTYKEVLTNMTKYDACAIIGGSIFQDYGDKRDYLNYIRRNLVIKSFRLRKKPVFIMGCNIGPINTKLGEKIFKSSFNNVRFTSVRDNESYQLLKNLNIKKNYDVYPDLVFSLEDTHNIYNKKDILGISVINYGREKEHQLSYINKIVELINLYISINDDSKVSLFGFDAGNENDGIIIDEILSRIKPKDRVEKVMYEGDMEVFLEKFKASTFIIGSRFHSIILALKYKLPFLPIIYSSKTENLLKDIEYNLESIEYKNINNLNVKLVIDNINNNNYKIDNSYITKSEGHFKEIDKVMNKNDKKGDIYSVNI